MKNFFIFIFIYLTITSYAQSQVAFIDMELILNNSLVGKKNINELNENKKKLLKEFKINEESLLNEEKLLSAQKNIIKNDEFEIKLKLLKKKVTGHNNSKKKKLDILRKKQVNMTTKLLKLINPILEDYSSKNSISILLQKKNIVIGNTNLDITPDILKLINKEISLN